MARLSNGEGLTFGGAQRLRFWLERVSVGGKFDVPNEARTMSSQGFEHARYRSIPHVLDCAAEDFGALSAIEDVERSLTFAELHEEARRVSAALISSEINVGDRVAIWAPNLWEWIVIGLGVHGAGGVIVPLNTRYKGHEAGYILRKSKAKMLFTVQGFLGHDYVSFLRDANGEALDSLPARDLPDLAKVVIVRGEVPDKCEALSDFVETGAATKAAELDARWSGVKGDDLSDILFTSGTTGSPKGVMTTHAQNIRAFSDWSDIVGLREGDRYLVVNPFFHSFGYKAGWLASLIRGATVIPHAVFDAIQVLKRIESDRVTVLPGAPALYQTILGSAELSKHDISTLRLAVTGAASIPVSLIQRMHDELGCETVLTAYGLTECCGVVTMCRQGDSAETIANTSGRAIPDVEVQVQNESGDELPRGDAGEIMVRGYNVMLGYFEDADKTAATVNESGWMHTGDIGVMDDAGNIQITDRKKDMFIVGGFNAYPAEIENLLHQNTDIVHAAVIGVPHERLGEVGAAYIVLRDGAAMTSDEVISWCRENMANFKVPREVHFVAELPRNATGKVVKYQLRKMHGEGNE